MEVLVPVTTPPPPMLEKLDELKKMGALTDAEYEDKRREVLSRI